MKPLITLYCVITALVCVNLGWSPSVALADGTEDLGAPSIAIEADTALSPAATLNNTMGEFSAQTDEENMIDQSGLSTGFTSGITDFDTYITKDLGAPSIAIEAPTALSPAATLNTILSPAATLNNTMGEFSAQTDAGNMIDQSGLSTGFTSGITDFDTYIGGSPTHADLTLSPENAFATPMGVTSGSIDFDLGFETLVDRFALWSDNTGDGPMNFSLTASLTADFAIPVALGSFLGADGTTPIPAQVFSFAPTSARYVRWQIFDTFDGVNINVGEVAFSSIPEPSRALLALLAFGAVLVRRRRSCRA